MIECLFNAIINKQTNKMAIQELHALLPAVLCYLGKERSNNMKCDFN